MEHMTFVHTKKENTLLFKRKRINGKNDIKKRIHREKNFFTKTKTKYCQSKNLHRQNFPLKPQ